MMSVTFVMVIVPRARDVTVCRIVDSLWTSVISVVVTTRAAGAVITSPTVASFLMRVGSVEEMAPAAGAVIMSPIAALYSMPAVSVVGIMPPVPGVMGCCSVASGLTYAESVMDSINLRTRVDNATMIRVYCRNPSLHLTMSLSDLTN